MADTRKQNSNLAGIIFGVVILVGLIGLAAFLLFGQGEDDESTRDQALGDDGITVYDPPREIDDYTLISAEAGELALSDLDGQLTLIYFGYTNCPDFCPPTMLDYAEIKETLGEDAENVNFVFVGVDTARDTAAFMTEYVNRYDSDFYGLTAETDTLDAMSEAFPFNFTLNEADENGFYTVDHTISKFLLDENGDLVKVFSWGLSASTIANEIRASLG